MYDGGKIIVGLILFVILTTFPLWFTRATGDLNAMPNPKAPEGTCVESKPYMRAYHMDHLNQWRDSVVRNGNRQYRSMTYPDKTFPMSLSDPNIQSCMSCHNNKAEFCDECHNYVGVDDPYCWDCHVAPQGN